MQNISSVFSKAHSQIKSLRSTNAPLDEEPKQPRGPAFRNASGGIGNIQYSELGVPLKDMIIYGSIIFFTFLGMCCFAAVAGFQSKYGIGVSGLSAYALFFSLFLLFLATLMLAVPLIFDKFDKMKRFALALQVPRVQLILHANGAFWMIILAMATTISAFTEKGCKDPSNDPHADLGDAFTAGLKGWCRTKRAGGIFFWLAFIGWAVLLAFTLLALRSARKAHQKDSSFAPPTEEQTSFTTPQAGYSQPKYPDEDYDEDEHADKVSSPFDDRFRGAPHAEVGGALAGGRASVDAYGAFSGNVPEGYGGYGRDSPALAPPAGRPMQMAPPGGPVDPFNQIRTALTSPPPQLPPLQHISSHFPPTPAPYVAYPTPSPQPYYPSSTPPAYPYTQHPPPSHQYGYPEPYSQQQYSHGPVPTPPPAGMHYGPPGGWH